LGAGDERVARCFAEMVVAPELPGASDTPAIQVRLGGACIDIAGHASAALVTATLQALAR